MFLYTKAENSGVGLSDIQNMSPYEMLKNPDGSLTNVQQYYWPIMQRFVPMSKFPYADWTYNPIQEVASRDLTTEQLNTRIQAGLTFKILRGLSIESKGQYELFNTFNRGLYNENTFFVRRSVNQATTWNQTVTPNTFTLNLPKGSILTQNRSNIRSYNWRNQVNFNRTFAGKHEINLIAGEELNNIVTQVYGYPTSYGYNDKSLTVGTFPNGPGGTFFQIKNWLGTNQTFSYVNSFTYATERYFSFYANTAYTFDRKYTLSGSYRTDASNLITDDPEYRYAPFWSAGLGWQIYKEDFMKNISWVDRLNIRLTYGYNGNVDRSTSFRPLIATSATPNTYSGDFTASISSFGNPTLRWEKTGTWNFGIDYSIFNNKLFGKIDLYNKQGKDLIAQLSIPAINGTTSQKLNNAEMTNKGIELEVGTSLNITKDISWRGNLNFAYNKNKITNLFVATYAASTLVGGGTGAYVVGANANSLWRFQYAGFVNGEPSVQGAKGATYNFLAFTPGDGREYLLNMGTTVPPYIVGFSSSFQVKDFNLSFIMTGKFGYVFQRFGFNYPSYFSGRVLPNKKVSEVLGADPSQIVTVPLTPNEPRYYFWDRFHPYLSYLVESASHIRMQEVNLTYTLPKHLLPSWNIARLQAYVQGNDLFTILWNKAKEDPEYPMGTMKPMPKFTFGIRCEL
jgi:TonB-dependent starch-binding outer membrane protein SusC